MTLQEFLKNYMCEYNLNKNQFSKLLGTSHSTVSRLLNDTDLKPTLDILGSIADVTGTDLKTLVAMVDPERSTQDIESDTLALQIKSLPDDQRILIESAILGFLKKNRQG